MKETMVDYFLAEKRESALFVAAGLLAIGLSIYLLVAKHPFRGLVAPLVIVGAIQIAVGGAVLARTDAQLAALVTKLEASPGDLAREETARMTTVMKNFTLYKIIEIVILTLGLGLTFAFSRRLGLYSAGIGCVGQGALMLVLDLFAEHRGQVYLDALARL